MQNITVFLSSTYRDQEWRDAARQTIESLPGFSSVVVEASPATMRAPEQDVLDRIIEADVFLIIVGSYGTMLPQRSQSFSEYEYDIAKKAGKPIIALVFSELTKQKSNRVWKFADRLRSEHAFAYFHSVESLRDRIATALFKLLKTTFASTFKIRFDPELSETQVKDAFAALADYYRACGGVGLSVDFEFAEAQVRETVDA